MRAGKWWLLASISFIIVILSIFLLTVVVSEIAYYLSAKTWYFSRDKQTNVSNLQNDYSLYREPFSMESKRRFRILSIGGSTTYGFGVDTENTWPQKLSTKLHDRYPNSYEVVNLGRLGGHLEEFIQNYHSSSTVYIPRDKWMGGARPKASELAKWGWKDLNPDVILLAPVVNDTAPDYLYLAEPNIIARSARSILDAGSSSFFFNKLALGFYVKKTLAILELRNRKPVSGDEVKLARIRQEYKKNLVNFIKLWDNHVRIYLIGLPFLFNEEDNLKQADQAAEFWNISDRSSIRQEVHYLPLLEKLEISVRAEVARELNIPYREIGDEIKRKRFPQRLRLYGDSIHMNAQGVKLVADEMYQVLIADGTIKNPKRGIKTKQ